MDELREDLDPLNEPLDMDERSGETRSSEETEEKSDNLGCSPFSLPMLVGVTMIMGGEETDGDL